MYFADLLKLISLHLLISSSAYEAKFLPGRSLSSAFELIKTQKKVNWESFDVKTVSSETKCGLSCSRNHICRAFTVCNSTICNLYSSDVFSSKKGYSILGDDANCNYYAMKKDSAPSCRTDGTQVDIQNDSQSTLCDIQSKRIDAIWSDWAETETVIDSVSEFKEVRRRSLLLEEAHGGIPGNSEKIVSWLIFVREQLPWGAANDYCLSLGGRLFSELDGSVDQINFLISKMDVDTFWLGIIFLEDENSWISTEGEVMDSKILWGEFPPDGSGGDHFAGILAAEGHVHNFDGASLHGSVCNMLIEE